MLKAGIVGIKNSQHYLSSIENLNTLEFSGIYDPSFQIDFNLFKSVEKGFDSFSKLLEVCDLVIFSSDDKVFYHLMREALSKSKAIFLDSVHKFGQEQLKDLSNLASEAKTIVQVYHPNLFHNVFKYYSLQNVKPIVIQSEVEIQDLDKITKQVREEITTVLYLAKNKVRKVRTNITSSSTTIPNIYQISIEFNNGCTGNLLATAVNVPLRKKMRIISVGAHAELDFVNEQVEMFSDGKGTTKSFKSVIDESEILVTRQLDDFCMKIENYNSLDFSLLHEIEACDVMQRVTEKLKICMSII